jgi:anti-sigma factor ChrR (cupin superfamily)
MNINADYSQRAVINHHELPWIASAEPGVERRMLERQGDEVAKATSIVRYN